MESIYLHYSEIINQVIDCFPQRSKCTQEMGHEDLILSRSFSLLELQVRRKIRDRVCLT